MNKKVLLVHGWGGSDYPHWQAWLASELAKEYGCVNFLRLKDFDNPKRDIWSAQLLEALEDFQPDIVICHSLANTLWFHLCSTTALRSIESLYLVAPPSMSCEIKELQEFFPQQAPKRLFAKEALLIGSTNDPYITIDELYKLQKKLDIDIKILKNAGHINTESGYGEWPWILNSLKNTLLI